MVAMDLKTQKMTTRKAGSSGAIRNNSRLIIITDNIFIFIAILLVFFNTKIMHLINVIRSK